MIKNAKNLAFGLAVALSFFLVLEGILWIFGVEPLHERADPYVGFSDYSPLFVEKVLPDGRHFFATANNKMNWFNYQQFPVRKSKGVTRIFCLGGSTTYGRPYDDKTSFCGWLRAFLPAVDPSRHWEVINAGGISYASYRVAQLMEALVQYEPDLFVIYTGHNEFLEKRTYDRLLRTPKFLRNLASLASRLRLYSLLSDVIYSRKDILATEVDALLDKSVGPDDYHRDDEMRGAVLEHFQVSLERMTRIGQDVGTDIIFITPASNIKDFSPFKAEPNTGLDMASIQQVDFLKQTITRFLDNNEPQQAADFAAKALEIDPRNADLLFLNGRALLALNQINEARRAFITARDEDIVPLRALTPVPGIIADVAQNNGNNLVDFARMIEEDAQYGIPGKEHFLDHVHPTIEGNRKLALAIVDEMIEMGTATPATTWSDAAISKITKEVKNNVDSVANATALTNLSRVMTWAGKQEEALQLVERANSINTDHHTLFQKVSVLCRNGKFEEALPFSEQATQLMPKIPAVRLTHGIILAQLGRNVEALQELETVAGLDNTMKDLFFHMGIVLTDLGYKDRAESTYRKALELEPENANVCNNLGILLANRGELKEAMNLFDRAVKADPRHLDAIRNLERARRMQ